MQTVREDFPEVPVKGVTFRLSKFSEMQTGLMESFVVERLRRHCKGPGLKSVSFFP